MSEPTVFARTQGAVLELSLNRPEHRNALNTAVRSQLREHIAEATLKDSIRAIVIRGEGDHFCAGADIHELAERRLPSAAWAPDRLDVVLEQCGMPVVVAMQGYALGGGLELSLAGTMRIIADNFIGGLPEIKLGIFPALGGTQRLPRMVGESRALSLILTGRTFDASEAERWGIATLCVPANDLRDEALALADKLAQRPPIAVRAATEAVRTGLGMSRGDGLEFERKLFGIVCASDDKDEGVSAWMQKRDPEFKGQ